MMNIEWIFMEYMISFNVNIHWIFSNEYSMNIWKIKVWIFNEYSSLNIHWILDEKSIEYFFWLKWIFFVWNIQWLLNIFWLNIHWMFIEHLFEKFCTHAYKTYWPNAFSIRGPSFFFFMVCEGIFVEITKKTWVGKCI